MDPNHSPLRNAPTPAMRNLASLFAQRPPVDSRGARFTTRRVQNLLQARSDYVRGALRLKSYPLKLTIEATNVCNLRCPACYTGAQTPGRGKRPMTLELYQRIMEELGPYLFEVEFHNWGEPLLAKSIYDLIAIASQAGVSTTISSNLSVPFDASKAERLVASGLQVLGVSIDGASQEVYQQYRVRGDLELVLRNCRLIADAKRRLGSSTPLLYWAYHVFSHNVEEVARARELATELGMEFSAEKGWVIGEEWDPRSEYRFFTDPSPNRCFFLWYQAVINNDGGMAPCCGTYYPEDDVGRISVEALDKGSFLDLWNGERYQAARALFRSRKRSEENQSNICFECPITLIWEQWKEHLSGRGEGRFEPGYTTNDVFNFFWNRKPTELVQLGTKRVPGAPGQQG